MKANVRSIGTDVPQHVLKRRSGRQTCFSCADDFEVYRLALEAAGFKHACHIHAYALMGHQVHLLVTQRVESGLIRMMRSVVRRYGRYHRRQYGRKEPIWKDRIQVRTLDAPALLLDCHRFVELNPVRAALTDRPEAWPWSSHRHNAFGFADSLVSPTDWYTNLGAGTAERQEQYRRMFSDRIESDPLVPCWRPPHAGIELPLA